MSQSNPFSAVDEPLLTRVLAQRGLSFVGSSSQVLGAPNGGLSHAALAPSVAGPPSLTQLLVEPPVARLPLGTTTPPTAVLPTAPSAYRLEPADRLRLLAALAAGGDSTVLNHAPLPASLVPTSAAAATNLILPPSLLQQRPLTILKPDGALAPLTAVQLVAPSVLPAVAEASSLPLSQPEAATETKSGSDSSLRPRKKRRYQHEGFPDRLYRLLTELEGEGKDDIISFSPDGSAFKVHKEGDFQQVILPRYFRHKNFSSFRRQLLWYGFERVKHGPNRGAFQHKHFRRGHRDDLKRIHRIEKSTGRIL